MFQFLGHFPIAHFVGVEVNNGNFHSVLHLGLTQVMQMSVPMAERFQVFGHVPRKKDVPRIATIHHALGNVNSSAGNVRAAAHVDHATDRAAVHAHAQLELRMLLYCAADL